METSFPGSLFLFLATCDMHWPNLVGTILSRKYMILLNRSILDSIFRWSVRMATPDHIIDRRKDDDRCIHYNTPIHGAGSWIWITWEEGKYENRNQETHGSNI